MGHVIESGAGTGIFNRVAIQEQLLGSHQAAIYNILVWAHSGYFFKNFAQVEFVHKKLCRQCIQCEFLAVIGVDIIDDRIDAAVFIACLESCDVMSLPIKGIDIQQ